MVTVLLQQLKKSDGCYGTQGVLQHPELVTLYRMVGKRTLFSYRNMQKNNRIEYEIMLKKDGIPTPAPHPMYTITLPVSLIWKSPQGYVYPFVIFSFDYLIA